MLPPRENQRARGKWQNLKQKGMMQNYAKLFNQSHAKANSAEAEAMPACRNGLSNCAKRMAEAHWPEPLTKMMELAENFSINPYYNPHAARPPTTSSATPMRGATTPTDDDMMEMRQARTEEQRQEYRRKGLRYRCGKHGRRARGKVCELHPSHNENFREGRGSQAASRK